VRAQNADSAIVWIPSVVLSALFLAMYYFRYHNYILVSDDISIFGAALDQNLSQWLTEGFSKYTAVYPEWFTPITNLARPAANGIFYVHYLLFSRHFGLYFVLFYILQFCSSLVVFYFLRLAGVSIRITVLFLIIFLLNPAFINYGSVLLSYQLDVFASAFLLIAFFALWKAQYVVTLIMLTMAVFTKEALFAPVAASMTVFVWKRHYSLAVIMLLPLSLWVAQRLSGFGTLAAGNYSVAPGIWGVATGVLKGIIIWPTGIIPGAGMFGLLDASSLALTFYSGVLFCNVLLWITLLYSGFLIVRRLREQREPHDDRFQILVALFIWAMGALSFCVVLGLGYVRYGASVYSFMLLFLAAMLFSDIIPPSITRLSKVTIFLLIVACIGNAIKFFTVDFVENGRQRALYDALRSLPSDGRTLYVVNAPEEIGASSNFLTTAWQITAKVVFINQLSGCVISSVPMDAGTSISADGELSVRIPKCASYKFANADSRILALGVEGELPRPGVGTYQFPHGRISGYWFQDPSVPILDFGDVMLVKLEDPSVAILTYNWPDARYTLYQGAK
jgi:hypothetical protein